MKKPLLIGILSILMIVSMVAAGFLLVDLTDDEVKVGTLCTFPITVGERNYTTSVRSNYSVSDASYFGLLRSISVDFRGSERATVLFNMLFEMFVKPKFKI